MRRDAILAAVGRKIPDTGVVDQDEDDVGLIGGVDRSKESRESRAKENFMVVLLIPLKRSKVSAQAVWDDSATRRDSESSPNGIFLL